MKSEATLAVAEAQTEALAIGAEARANPRAPAPRASFETTRWHVVLGAGQGVRADVVELCQSYWYPVYAFIRSQGVNADEAPDITQDLFAALIRRNDFAKVDPARGRFRSWLRTAAKNQLRNHYAAKKLPAGCGLVSIDAMSAEERYQLEPKGKELAPDQLFDRYWAATLVRRTREQLRLLYEGRGKAALFARLEPTLVRDESAVSDAELSAELGKTLVDIRQTRLRMKSEYGRLLRAEAARALSDPRTIDDELRHLMDVLS